jgi:hypothetical protein
MLVVVPKEPLEFSIVHRLSPDERSHDVSESFGGILLPFA